MRMYNAGCIVVTASIKYALSNNRVTQTVYIYYGIAISVQFGI